MLSPYFYTTPLFEFADKTRVPRKDLIQSKRKKNRTHHSSLATPRSLQQRISALLLQASVAVGIPAGSKYSCSPLAIATNLCMHQRPRRNKISKGNKNTPSQTHQCIFSADNSWTDIGFGSWSEAPTTRAKCFV